MTSYAYEAVDTSGLRIEGTMDVASQHEALRRIKEMGLFPTRVSERRDKQRRPSGTKRKSRSWNVSLSVPGLGGRVKPRAVTVFTRQLATLIEAGMPLLRGLRILQQQEANSNLRRILAEMEETIEGGSSLSDALARHPRVFNRLYINMVKAGEIAGALELTLRRLAEFMEKAQRIKGKVKSALYYPLAVIFVALAVVTLMMVFVLPRFQQVFHDLLNGAPMPAFTVFMLRISEVIRHHALGTAAALVAVMAAFTFGLKTKWGRWMFDQFKLVMPALGAVFRKAAIARFARTLGTLLGNGVPILQALQIVKETAGNVVVGNVVSSVHECVKQGESITMPLRGSRVFPPMIVGMVDVGEQTGALPDMLLKIADTYDEEVDNAVSATTSLLEPLLIVFLAVVVGSIVIAMFLPIIGIITSPGFGGPAEKE